MFKRNEQTYTDEKRQHTVTKVIGACGLFAAGAAAGVYMMKKHDISAVNAVLQAKSDCAQSVTLTDGTVAPGFWFADNRVDDWMFFAAKCGEGIGRNLME